MMKQISTYVLRYWFLHVAVLAFSLLAAGIALVQPWLFQVLIDEVLVGRQREMLALVLLGYAATHIGGMAIEIVRHYCSVLAGNKAVVDLRNDLVHHLRRLSLGFFYREETGRIMSVMTNDAPAMERLLQSLAPQVIMDLSYLIVMAYIISRSGYPMLILTAFAMVPFYIFFPTIISTTFRQAFRQVQESQADISAGLQESISSTREVVAFNRENWDERRLSTLFARDLKQRLRLILLEARYGALQNLASFVSPFLILVVGAPYVLRGDLTVGYILAFQQWTQLLYSHGRSLYNTNQAVQQSLGAAERVFQFFDEPIDPVRLGGDRCLETVEGAITFENVYFSYDGSRDILHGINLEIQPGMRVAVVGPSGAGKSTLFSLIVRFFDPGTGRILLDNVDCRDLDVEWLRRQVGLVFQDPFLFSGTLYENIAFGREGASFNDVKRASELANVDAFVDELSEGYDTVLGERGARLSGGQKQRVAIARTLLRDPKILLLDEATSALDSESEAKVQGAMQTVMHGRTSLIIAHRLSTIQNADQIVFLKEGQVTELGTHDRLIQNNGDYARFYKIQFRDGDGDMAS